MSVNPRNFGRSRNDKWNHRVGINIRLRRHRSLGGAPTQQELRDVLVHLLDTGGVLPSGWQFAAIKWGRPEVASDYWQSGRIRDFNQFVHVIEHQLDRFRYSIVRPGE